MAQANGMYMLQGTNMREVIKYYNDALEKDEIEKEELKNKIKDLENVCRDLTIQVLNLTPIEEGGEK